MTTEQAKSILVEVRAKVGRRYYKANIRHAWESGDYASVSLVPWAGELQRIRNVLGPTWLVNVRLP